ncbi:hypothetical protein PRIPAC_91888, partial [Pristionchus pacificus]|uniref:Uncharacterized protein n=1 Tax=Pristionchus pacificus TaxID=54126 RepID=A0A2A6BQM3_PRIPA
VSPLSSHILPSFSLREWLERGSMRLWICFVTAFGLLLLCGAEYKPLEPCPKDRVCLLFTDDVCSRHGVRDPHHNGYIWDENTQCENPHFGLINELIHIQPLTSTKWKVLMTGYSSSSEGDS